jgi:hypothetical protein
MNEAASRLFDILELIPEDAVTLPIIARVKRTPRSEVNMTLYQSVISELR